MRLIQVYWFTCMSGCIGVVVGEDEITKAKKAYIGVVSGSDEDADTKTVMELGSPVSLRWLVEMVNHMTPPAKGVPG